MASAEQTRLQAALEHIVEGEWPKAHAIVQQETTSQAHWLHGIVHLMAGDPDNARYWYRRANRAFSEDLAGEIAAARGALQQQ